MSYRYGEQPDADWQERVLSALEQTRRSRLAGLGYEGGLLDLLVDSAVDVDELAALVQRGCPPGTAARILL